MAKVTFDGDKLLITILSGVTDIDVKVDLYSDWKEWKLIDDNAKYPPAFRTSGGDPLTPGVNAGAYYFLQNQYGWRIKPAEENQTVFIDGNLAPEDTTRGIAVPTNGGYTSLLLGLQPITQSVESLLLQQQDSSYFGTVYVDFVNGVSDTSFPAGTATSPTNSVANAFTIANSLGISKFVILNGTFTTTQDVTSYTFVGGGGQAGFDPNGYDTTGSVFQGIILDTVDFSGSTNLYFQQCTFDGTVQNLQGKFTQCAFNANISFSAGRTIMDYCYSTKIPSDHVDMDTQGLAVNIVLSSWSGSLDIYNLAAGSSFQIDSISARVELGANNTGGDVVLRGVGDIVDNSQGAVNINRDGFIEGTDLIQLREYIYVNTETGVTGQGENDGISTNPVNNMADAYALSVKRNINKFSIYGNVTLDRDYQGYDFVGSAGKENSSVNLGGYNPDKSSFVGLTLGGTGSTGYVTSERCKLSNLSGVSGIFTHCGLSDVVLPGNNTTSTFIDCYSEVPGSGTPTIDLGLLIDSDLQVRGYNGGLTLYNVDHVDQKVSVDLASGHLKLDSTCTAGEIVVRGAGYLTDNSNGSTVIIKGLLGNPSMIGAYAGMVTIDTTNGVSGTEYPVGTAYVPVSNLNDAKAILSMIGTDHIEVVGTLVVGATGDLDQLRVSGRSKADSSIVLTSGCTTDRTDFSNITLAGVVNGAIYASECNLSAITNIGSDDYISTFNDCLLRQTTFSLRNGLTTPKNIVFTDCVSGNPGTTRPILDYNGTTSPVIFRKYGGGLQIINYTGGQESTIELEQGYLDLPASNTSGTLIVSGLGTLNDNSTLTITNELLDGGAITTQVGALDERIDRILGLSQQNYRITNQVYDDKKLLSSTIRIYANATDANNDVNPTYEYSMVATYDASDRITSYKVVEI